MPQFWWVNHNRPEDEAQVAARLIEAAADDSAKAVLGDIDAHKKVLAANAERSRPPEPVGCGLGNTPIRASRRVSALHIPGARHYEEDNYER